MADVCTCLKIHRYRRLPHRSVACERPSDTGKCPRLRDSWTDLDRVGTLRTASYDGAHVLTTMHHMCMALECLTPSVSLHSSSSWILTSSLVHIMCLIHCRLKRDGVPNKLPAVPTSTFKTHMHPSDSPRLHMYTRSRNGPQHPTVEDVLRSLYGRHPGRTPREWKNSS